MNELIVKGVEFGTVVRAAMSQTLGDTQTEIILAMIGEPSRKEPAALVRGLSTIFGDGARAVYDSVVAEAKATLTRMNDVPPVTVFEELTEGMKAPSKGHRVRMEAHGRETRFEDEDS